MYIFSLNSLVYLVLFVTHPCMCPGYLMLTNDTDHCRDYCCIRQHLTDPRGHIVVSSRTTQHHKCPVTNKNWRVEDYQSVMAVRPPLPPDKPGVEFSVTAFEDPGVTLPDTIVNW